MRSNVKFLKAFVMVILLIGNIGLQASVSDDDSWLQEDPRAIFDAINEGELIFLLKPPKKLVHHHRNILTVSSASIKTGWVKLEQCHENLDEFPSAQIVYNKDKIRNIKLLSYRNIGRVWIEAGSLQLTDIKLNARVCMEAETRALIIQKDGTFIMKNGPFMRKFLDGYFPMRVSMKIKLPPEMQFIGIEPKEQKGFKVVRSKQEINFDTWFEGRLTTKIHLKLNAKINSR